MWDGYQVVISRGLKCGLRPIRVTLLKPGIPPRNGFLQNESHLHVSRLNTKKAESFTSPYPVPVTMQFAAHPLESDELLTAD